MSRILVSGSVAYDRIMDFPGHFKDHFLPDKLHNINVSFSVDTFTENFGGTAGNVAYTLALLNHQPRIISTAGADFHRYEQYLNSLHIDPASIRIDPERLSSSAFIVTDRSDNQIAAFSMAAGGGAYAPLPETEGCACAIIGAGCPEDIRVLPKHYRSAEVSHFYDPGQSIPVLSADDLRSGIEGAAAVFGNDYEISLVMNKTGWSEAQILEKAKVLVVTLGEKGSRVVTSGGEKKVQAVPVSKVVDPTGAGDAYRAGYITGYLHDLPPEVCAQIGSATAVYAIENHGTQSHHFTMDELKKRYESAYKEELPLK